MSFFRNPGCKRCIHFFLVILFPLFIVLMSCNKKSTGNDDNGDLVSFFPPPDGTAWLYQVNWGQQGERQFHMLATVVGEDDTTFPGESFTRIEMFDTTEAQFKTGMILWLDASTPLQLGYKAVEVYQGFQHAKRNQQQGQEWDEKYVADETTYSIFSGDEGEQVQVTSTGRIYYGGEEVGEPATLVADVTVESLNATTTVPYGTVSNCVKLTGTGTKTTPSDNFQTPLEICLSPALGIVSVNMTPGFDQAYLDDFYPVD